MRRKYPITSKHVLAFCLFALIGIFVLTLIKQQPSDFTYKYSPQIALAIQHDRSHLNKQLQQFGISFDEPLPALCAWNPDPELRLFECSSTAHVIHANNPQSVDTIFQELGSLDKSLKADGWTVGANDYRLQNIQGTHKQLLQGGIPVAYSYGTADYNDTKAISCYFIVSISTTDAHGSYEELTCGNSTSFFLLDTPRSAHTGG